VSSEAASAFGRSIMLFLGGKLNIGFAFFHGSITFRENSSISTGPECMSKRYNVFSHLVRVSGQSIFCSCRVGFFPLLWLISHFDDVAGEQN